MVAWRAWLIALQFLTRLPIRLREPPETHLSGASVAAYPWVGAVLGAALAGLAWAAAALGLKPLLAAALLLVLWVAATGALHLDGLADSADAWVGGLGNRERTLAIMKDPNCGPMGVTTLVLILLLKFVALGALLQDDAAAAVAIASLLARTALAGLLLVLPYARTQGLGSALVTDLPRAVVGVSIALALALTLALAVWRGQGLAALLVAALLFFALVRAMRRRLGGWTGDTAGALVEIIETGVVVALAV